MSRHHRKPKSLGGTAEPANISHIDGRKHRAWHVLFQNMAPEQIVAEINRYYLDPDYKMHLSQQFRLSFD